MAPFICLWSQVKDFADVVSNQHLEELPTIAILIIKIITTTIMIVIIIAIIIVK